MLCKEKVREGRVQLPSSMADEAVIQSVEPVIVLDFAIFSLKQD